MPSAFKNAFYGLLVLLLLFAPGQDPLPAGQAGPWQAMLVAKCEYWFTTGHWALYYECLRRHRQAREREEAAREQERRKQERLNRERREREEAARLEEERLEEERLAREAREQESRGDGTDPLSPGLSDPFASPQPESSEDRDWRGRDDEDEDEDEERGEEE
jgi:hypothetical protein